MLELPEWSARHASNGYSKVAVRTLSCSPATRNVERIAQFDKLTCVSEAAFKAFGKPQQMAFLINAYNAFTVELILTKYPGLASIKDLGSVFSSPWHCAS